VDSAIPIDAASSCKASNYLIRDSFEVVGAALADCFDDNHRGCMFADANKLSLPNLPAGAWQ
jgi:hypothetical protein